MSEFVCDRLGEMGLGVDLLATISIFHPVTAIILAVIVASLILKHLVHLGIHRHLKNPKGLPVIKNEH